MFIDAVMPGIWALERRIIVEFCKSWGYSVPFLPKGWLSVCRSWKKSDCCKTESDKKILNVEHFWKIMEIQLCQKTETVNCLWDSAETTKIYA